MAAVNFTLCPPMSAHQVGTWKQCLSKRMLPVHKPEENEDGSFENGLDFSDYSRCQTFHHGKSGERRLETPAWCMDSAALRKVLITYLLNRAISQKACERLSSLSEREQLQTALKALRAKEQNLIRRLVLLEKEYVDHAKCIQRRKVLRRAISGLDSQICLNRRPDFFFRVIYSYFFLRLDSTGTAMECDLTPWAVRQILRRMCKTAERLGYAPPEVRQQGHTKKVTDLHSLSGQRTR